MLAGGSTAGGVYRGGHEDILDGLHCEGCLNVRGSWLVGCVFVCVGVKCVEEGRAAGGLYK